MNNANSIQFPSIPAITASFNNQLLIKSAAWNVTLANQDYQIKMLKKEMAQEGDSLTQATPAMAIKIKLTWQSHPCSLHLSPAFIYYLLGWEDTDIDLSQLPPAQQLKTFSVIVALFREAAKQNAYPLTFQDISLVNLLNDNGPDDNGPDDTGHYDTGSPLSFKYSVSNQAHSSEAHLTMQEDLLAELYEWLTKQASEQQTPRLVLPLSFSLFKSGCKVDSELLESLKIGDVLLMDGDQTRDWGIRLNEEETILLSQSGVQAYAKDHNSYDAGSLHKVDVFSDSFLTTHNEANSLLHYFTQLLHAQTRNRTLTVNNVPFASGKEVRIGNRWGVCIESFINHG